MNVLYAGSLVKLMEHGIGPAFDKADGGDFRGYAGGSNKLANEIKGKLVPGDVFISANPKVNADLKGATNGRLGRLVCDLRAVPPCHRVQSVEPVRSRSPEQTLV